MEDHGEFHLLCQPAEGHKPYCVCINISIYPNINQDNICKKTYRFCSAIDRINIYPFPHLSGEVSGNRRFVKSTWISWGQWHQCHSSLQAHRWVHWDAEEGARVDARPIGKDAMSLRLHVLLHTEGSFSCWKSWNCSSVWRMEDISYCNLIKA